MESVAKLKQDSSNKQTVRNEADYLFQLSSSLTYNNYSNG